MTSLFSGLLIEARLLYIPVALSLGFLSASNNFAQSTVTESAKGSIPTLVSPAAGSVLDNGCRKETRPSCSDKAAWAFEWSPVKGAEKYQLYVVANLERRPRAGFIAPKPSPIIDLKTKDTSYSWTTSGVIVAGNNSVWKWKVRAMIGGRWSAWTDEREFVVEESCLDCRFREPRDR